jgi:membrane protein implicated in regulation of membrane protease activity
MFLNNKFFTIFYKIALICLVVLGIGGATFFVSCLVTTFLFAYGIFRDNNSTGANVQIVIMAILSLPALFLAYKVIKRIIKSNPKKFNDSQGAILDYIKAARFRNISDQQIKDQLINEGYWSETIVVGAFSKSN